MFRRAVSFLGLASLAVATLLIALLGDDGSRRAPITAVLVAQGTSVPVTRTAIPWQQPPPTPTRTPVSTASPAPTVSPSPAANPSPESTPEPFPARAVGGEAEGASQFIIGNTGGDGALLRPAPGSDDLIRGWPDETPLTVVGPDQTLDGTTWRNVRDPEGNVGWVAAQFLLPVP